MRGSLLLLRPDLHAAVERLAECKSVKGWVAMTDRARIQRCDPPIPLHEELLDAENDDFDWPESTRTAAALCYTSGTTAIQGRALRHRSTLLHRLLLSLPDAQEFLGRPA